MFAKHTKKKMQGESNYQDESSADNFCFETMIGLELRNDILQVFYLQYYINKLNHELGILKRS